jgi:hypothetical protein
VSEEGTLRSGGVLVTAAGYGGFLVWQGAYVSAVNSFQRSINDTAAIAAMRLAKRWCNVFLNITIGGLALSTGSDLVEFFGRMDNEQRQQSFFPVAKRVLLRGFGIYGLWHMDWLHH